jgi:hypothetical protein
VRSIGQSLTPQTPAQGESPARAQLTRVVATPDEKVGSPKFWPMTMNAVDSAAASICALQAPFAWVGFAQSAALPQ